MNDVIIGLVVVGVIFGYWKGQRAFRELAEYLDNNPDIELRITGEKK